VTKDKRTIKHPEDPDVPLVTVFTVVRNGQDLLARAIRSVAAQTYLNIEYIVVDGASTDGTLDVIKSFDSHVDYWISEPDLGPGDACNKAITLASGEFLFWLSSDDWIDPDYIQMAVKT